MTDKEYNRATIIAEIAGEQQLSELQYDLYSVFDLSWFDIRAIIEMVIMFYPFDTWEKSCRIVWQFCQRLENN